MTWENIKMIVVIVGAAVLVTFCLAKPIGAYQMGRHMPEILVSM